LQEVACSKIPQSKSSGVKKKKKNSKVKKTTLNLKVKPIKCMHKLTIEAISSEN
jgi:hypothetical protein